MTFTIKTANAWIYDGLNNAVYRAGFAESQCAYEQAVATVFETLDRLERRLASAHYNFGAIVTETDFRIFPTLVRFDAVYTILFKCSFRRLTDYPNLWAYARDIFSMRGVRNTVNFDHMRSASYLADSRDPHSIIAIAPDVDWEAPHNRSDLGSTELVLRSGETVSVDPATLASIT